MEIRLADNFGIWRTFLRIRVGVMYMSPKLATVAKEPLATAIFLLLGAWGIGMEKLRFGGHMVYGTGVYYPRVIINPV